MKVSEKKESESACKSELLASEARYRRLFESAKDGILILDAISGKIIDVNPFLVDLLGYSKEKFIDKELWEIGFFKDIAANKEKFAELQQKKYVRYDNLPLETASGTKINVEFVSNVYLVGENAVIQCNIRDITKRKKFEKKVIESEKRFKAIFDQAPLGMALLDMQGQLRIVNSPLSKMLGYSSAELTKMKFTDFTFSEDIDKDMSQFADLIEGKICSYSMEKRYVHKNGRLVWVNLFVSILCDENGIAQEILGMAEDITEHKQAEKAILQSEKKFKSYIDFAPDGIFVVDESGNYVDINDSACKMTGYSRNELLKMSITNILAEESFEDGLQHFKNLVEKGISKGDLTYKQKNGVHRWWSLDAVKLSEKLYLGFAKDITERKKTEVEIRDLAKFPSESPNPIMRISRNGILLYVNEAGRKQLPDWKLHIDKSAPTKLKNVVFNTMQLGEVQVAEIEHDKKIYSFYVAPLITDGYANLYGWDITERKQAEKELQESELRFRTLYDNAKIGLYRTTFDGNILMANKALIKMLGYSSFEKLSERNLKKEGYEPTYQRKEFLEMIEKNGVVNDFECAWVRLDGSVFFVRESAQVIRNSHGEILYYDGIVEDITERKQAETEIAMLAHSLKSINECVSITDLNNNILFVNESFLKTYGYGYKELIGKNINIIRSRNNQHEIIEEILPATIIGEWQGELLNRRKDGSEFPIYLSTSVIRDKEDIVLGLIGVATDITERKRTEIELIASKEKAEENDRLKSAFLANMSHEVRTPLNSIIGFSELLGDSDFDEEQKGKFIHNIITSGNNLLSIISDIMDISKLDSGEYKIRNSKINVQQFILNIKEQFITQLEAKKLEFKISIPKNGEETTIFADADRLKQIFINLISNALKFTANGKIEIGYQLNGKIIKFFVKDSGIGIPAEYHKIIFERFRQIETSDTRNFGGNGLGLAISKNLVELMGGEIWLESETGKGSAFYFTVPIYSETIK